MVLVCFWFGGLCVNLESIDMASVVYLCFAAGCLWVSLQGFVW